MTTDGNLYQHPAGCRLCLDCRGLGGGICIAAGCHCHTEDREAGAKLLRDVADALKNIGYRTDEFRKWADESPTMKRAQSLARVALLPDTKRQLPAPLLARIEEGSRHAR